MIKKLTPAAGGHEGVKGAAQMMMMMSSSSSWLTGPELEAANQLIQLSGDGHSSSSSSKDGRSTISSSTFDDDLVIMMVAPSDLEAAAVESYGADMTAKCSAEAIHDQDVASTSSSSSSSLSSSSSSSSCSAIKTGENFDVCEEIDASSCLFMMERKRKRKRKLRSIADLYANTKPNLVKKAAS